MRLSFPNGDNPDHPFSERELLIGTGTDCGLRIAGTEVASQHVMLRNEPRRGVCLWVLASGEVHLNGRPVREFAWLRPGDLVHIGSVPMLLLGEPPATGDDTLQPVKAGECGHAVVLRGLSGTRHGQSLPLAPAPWIGQGRGVDVPIDGDSPDAGRVRVGFSHGRVAAQAEGAGALRVNGHAVRSATLAAGDQLMIAGQRFVLEAPGLAAGCTRDGDTRVGVRAEAAAPPPRGHAQPLPDADRANTPLLWLIVAACLIAAGFAALLLHGH